jgi:O-antigen/teichoic acid export membrane protein
MAGVVPDGDVDAAGDYRGRAVRALTWNVAGRFAVQGVRFGFGVALARMLSPGDFGLLAMVTLLLQFGKSLADLGFGDALVQKRDLTERHRSAVFWTGLVTAIGLTAATWVLAPAIAAFYEVAELAPLARVLAPLFLLGAVEIVPRAIVERRLDFRRVVQVECAAAVLAGGVAVALAWRGAGVTSLVVQLLLATALESAFFLAASGWRPRWTWSASALGDLVGFGTNRVMTRTFGYWSRHVDELLVGKLIGVTALGLYTRAFNLIQVPVVYVSRAAARALFPSLAEIQDDAARVRRTHLRTTAAVALATVPMCFGLAALAEPVVLGLFGAQWRDMIPLVRILSVAALAQSITGLSASLFLSQGRPDLHLRVTLLQSGSTIVAVLVGRAWGVAGVALGFSLAAALVAVPTLHLAGRLVGSTIADVVRRVAPIVVAGVVMTAAVVLIDQWALAGHTPLERLAAGIAVGVAVYAGCIRIGRVDAMDDVAAVLRRSV